MTGARHRMSSLSLHAYLEYRQCQTDMRKARVCLALSVLKIGMQ